MTASITSSQRSSGWPACSKGSHSSLRKSFANAREIDSQSRLTRSISASAACREMPSATTSSAARSSAGLGTSKRSSPSGTSSFSLRDALGVLRVDLAEALQEVLGGHDFGGLGLERRRHRVAQAEQPLGQPVGSAQQPLDRGEVEAVGLQVEDQPQPRHVVGAVVADARAHLGRGQQAAGVVVADVAHRHAHLGGELLDRQVVAAGCCAAGLERVPAIVPVFVRRHLQFEDTMFDVTSFEVT